MKGKDFLSVADISQEEILSLLSDAKESKGKGWNRLLENRMLAILFEKPSLRTRVSFEVAMRQLGGQTLYLSPAEVGLGTRESVPDVARALCRFVDCISARTFSHKTVELLAEYADIPVINALSDYEHPCQAMADLLTIYEKKGGLEGLTLAYIGDGNNVANSLLYASAKTGMNFRIAAPEGYTLEERVIATAMEYARSSGSEIMCTNDPGEAIDNADVVYTDSWTSMGQEAETEVRRNLFANFQVNEKLMSAAAKDAIFMHCLPAHRGDEVTDAVADSVQSVIFDQAENRMHAQKMILSRLLG